MNEGRPGGRSRLLKPAAASAVSAFFGRSFAVRLLDGTHSSGLNSFRASENPKSARLTPMSGYPGGAARRFKFGDHFPCKLPRIDPG